MSRNDQVTRQLLLLQKLERSRGGVTIQELSAALPEDYSRHLRTIRRDLEALESIYPLVTDKHNGQTRLDRRVHDMSLANWFRFP